MLKANIAGEAPRSCRQGLLVGALKSACKRVPLFYQANGKYRGWEQSRQIELEQAGYEARARQTGPVPGLGP